MKKSIALAVSLLAAAGTVQAADLDQLENLGQELFRDLSEDLGAALSYKALIPAAPLGTTGIDIGIEVTATNLQSTDAFKEATGKSVSTLPVAKLHAHKGLPFGIDVGASYASVPGSNISVVGAELRYAFIKGGIATPALGLRGTYSALQGVKQLDFDTKGLELTLSKGFAMATPYAGIGQVWVTSTPNDIEGAESIKLKEESFSLPKYFAGVNFNMGLVNFLVEADQTGDATSYGVKLGFRF